MKIQLFDERKLPYEFRYCESIKKVVELNLVNLKPWEFIDDEWMTNLLPEMQRLYPKRKLIPFASNQTNSEIACFEVDRNEEVQIIHFGASDGWEQRSEKKIANFWSWFRSAIEEMIEFD